MNLMQNIERTLKALQLSIPKVRQEIEIFDIYVGRFQNIQKELRGAAYYRFNPTRLEKELKTTARFLFVYLKNRIDKLKETEYEYTKISSDGGISDEKFDEITAMLQDVSALISRGEGHLELLK